MLVLRIMVQGATGAIFDELLEQKWVWARLILQGPYKHTDCPQYDPYHTIKVDLQTNIRIIYHKHG